MTGDRPTHVFTVDVEEYFQVHAFDGAVSRSDWDVLPSRVERSVERLLALLEEFDVEGTFFTLGWIADKHPAVVRAIVDGGHEVASHGWWHRRVTELDREAFREDVRSSRRLLEDVAGRPVDGFRAPSFSLVPGQEWVFEVLLEEGYRYDSSVFPVKRLGYGYPGAPTEPFQVERASGRLLELPLATTACLGFRLPAAGGAYFRQLPYALTRRAFREHESKGRPAVFYVHPWELDANQPVLPVSAVARVRHYRGLDRVADRLRRLLSEFRFTSVRRRFPPEGLDGPASDGKARDAGEPAPPPGAEGEGESRGEARSDAGREAETRSGFPGR